MAENEDDLQRLLYRFSITTKEFRIDYIMRKTTVTGNLQKPPKDASWQLTPTLPNRCFNYLVMHISSDRHLTMEVKN